MSQPLDRTCTHEPLVPLDTDAGELHAASPFDLPRTGENLSAFERNCVFLNLKGQSFLNGSFASGADIDADSRAVIAADFNRDGRQDLLVSSVGGGGLRLFLNQLPEQNLIRFRLHGKNSNRPGIGVRMTAQCGEDQFSRDLIPTNGCLGLGPMPDLLGVGKHEKIDRLTLRWPTGKTQVFENLAVNQEYLFTEDNEKPGVLQSGLRNR